MKKFALKTAFITTIPIMTGFLFLGIVYGIYMNSYGFGPLYPFVMAAFIFAGSIEFLTVPLLLGPFHPLSVFLLTIMVNARHLFYGIALLDKYNAVRNWKRYYLIFGMCDESFSINYSALPAANINKEWFMFFVTVLNHIYWVTGATIGGVLANFINIAIPGLSFVMTALFLVIFIEQCLKERNWQSASAGIIFPLIALNIWGSNNFILPSMFLILFFLVIRKQWHKRKEPFIWTQLK